MEKWQLKIKTIHYIDVKMTCNATKMKNKVLKHCSVYVGGGGGAKGVIHYNSRYNEG